MWDLQAQLLEAQKRGEAGAWPSDRGALLLRLFLLIFPPSDFRHPVLAPLAVVLGHFLGQCHLSNKRDAAMALFLCNLAHR